MWSHNESMCTGQWKGTRLHVIRTQTVQKRVNESEQTNAKPKTEMNKMYYMYIEC